MSHYPTILLLVAEPALAERCAAALARWPAAQVERAARLDRPADIVVCDAAWTAAEATPDLGVIALGSVSGEAHSARPADVELPADFTDRELLLACRLLAETVRCRRETQSASDSRHEFEQLAHLDPLTGLPNRRSWDIVAPRRLQEARAAGQAVCVAIIDVDRFKRINDHEGHATGDRVLSAVGPALAEALRSGDFVARLGGDEFGLLLLGAFDATGAARIIDRVRQRVATGLSAAASQPANASAGLAVAPPGAAIDLETLAAKADEALRAAKQRGRHRTELAE